MKAPEAKDGRARPVGFPDRCRGHRRGELMRALGPGQEGPVPKGRSYYGRMLPGSLSRSRHSLLLDDPGLRSTSWATRPSAAFTTARTCSGPRAPGWNGVGRYLLWSDIPNNVQMGTWRRTGTSARSATPRAIPTATRSTGRAARLPASTATAAWFPYEYDGTITVLAHKVNGKELNAPNDAVVHPDDGAIWFTDPGYGSLMNYEGHKANTGSVQPLQKEAVYRIDAKTGKITKLTDEIYKPNGLCFSPDYKKLYVADTGASHYDDAPRNIKVWDIDNGKKLKNGREFTSMALEIEVRKNPASPTGPGAPTRTATSGPGRLGWCRLRRCSHLRARRHPDRPDPVARDLLERLLRRHQANRLFMTGSPSLYALYTEAIGAHIT
ncbi:MAG: gluconolactonase [Planctomycetaceae bacterium]|nr:MAG: gluconolactonase [Planctomycetaceae bacterium]